MMKSGSANQLRELRLTQAMTQVWAFFIIREGSERTSFFWPNRKVYKSNTNYWTWRQWNGPMGLIILSLRHRESFITEFLFWNNFKRNFGLLHNSNIWCSLCHWWSVDEGYCCWIQERSVASIGQFEPRTRCTWLNHSWRSNNDHRRIVQFSNVSFVIVSKWKYFVILY